MIYFSQPWFLLGLILVPAVLILYRRSGRPRNAVLLLRSLALLFLVLASALPAVRRNSDTVSAIFIVDVSDSLGFRGRERALALANRFLPGMRGEDQAGLISAGNAVVLNTSLRPGGAKFSLNTRQDGSQTRLADAVYMAIGGFRGEGERRIVLISDGHNTIGNLQEAVEFAGSSGILVDALPLGPEAGTEVSVEEVRAAEVVDENETHEVAVLMRSTHESAARLTIFQDGEYLGEDRFTLSVGESLRSYQIPGSDKGIREYEFLLDAAGDGFPENNRGLAVVRVEGVPRVLWVGDGLSAVPPALTVQGHTVDIVDPGGIPGSVEVLAAWDTVILDNVSAREISAATMAVLETWVRTQAGGLVMIGGNASFGLGGWQDSPIERALPVEMDTPASLYIPSLSMVMVIDKSGSMGSDAGSGATKLDLVKDAVLGAVEVLNPLYTVGVVAFDADWEWTVPVTDAGALPRIRGGLAVLESGGGTVLYPAIREAYDRLVQSPASIRHLVILSDGLAEPADYDELVNAIAEDGISVSTVAVGNDADSELMSRMAELGDGRFWYAESAAQVPRIFASESMIVSRGLTVEETVFPVLGAPAEALDGIDLSFLPPLHGYVMTTADRIAVEALRSPRGHPLLAYGYHGLGRSAAFTSDLRGSWGRDWIPWEHLPRLLSQTVKWTRNNFGEAGALSFVEDSDGLRFVLEARNPDGSFLSDLRPTASVLEPDGESRSVSMRQTAPGRYEGDFIPRGNGVFQVSVSDIDAGFSQSAYWTRAYSGELQAPGLDSAALADAARLGGGRLLTGTEDPREWWTVRSPQQRTIVSLGFLFALMGLSLFLFDVFLREVGSLKKKREPGDAKGEVNYSDLILSGVKADRMKPNSRRPSPAEAARILAERRARREGRPTISSETKKG